MEYDPTCPLCNSEGVTTQRTGMYEAECTDPDCRVNVFDTGLTPVGDAFS